VASDWLGGFGRDMTAVELVAHRVAGGYWDEDAELQASRPKGGDFADKVRRSIDFLGQLEQNRANRERAIVDILDLRRWVRLLGDPRPAEISEEAREQFALGLGRALRIATTRPIKGRPGEFRPRTNALEGLRDYLNEAADKS
jgi:hypothetical protein